MLQAVAPAAQPGLEEELRGPDGQPLPPAVVAQLRLEGFAQQLIGRRTEAVQWRSASGVERRWLDDLDAYHGRDEYNRPAGIVEVAAAGMSSAAEANSAPKIGTQQTARSTIYVQLTRQKTNAAAARVQEMLFPSDEKNWSIGPTPEPTLLKAVTQHGNIAWRDPQLGQLPHPDDPTGERKLTAGDVAAERMREAVERSEAMSKAIADKLEECGYVGHGRQVIMSAGQLGTGIIKGPCVVNATRREWQQHKDATGSVRVLNFSQATKPASFAVSCWDFFPDPGCGENVQDGGYVFEREWASGRKLRELARTKGYKRDAIRECLKEGAQRVTSTGSSYYEQARSGDGYNPQAVHTYTSSRYELWTYVGEVDREDLEALGFDIPEEQRDLASLSAIAVLCNDRIIKLALNPMDGGDLPYDVFVWERVAMSPWGVGIPFLMRYSQRTINAAWRALLDNMGASSGVQIVMSNDIQPVDGNMQIVGRKIWRAPKGTEVDKAFKVFEIPSRQADLQAVIRLAMEFADAETSLPQIAQGEQGNAPDTVGGMTMLMNAANTVLKRLARQFDESITKPHIRRYYDWMMAFHPDDAIKGDMEVAARGSTSLVQRDLRNQSMTEVMAAATHPVFSVFLNPEKLFRQYLESKSVTPDSVMATKDEVAAKMEEAKRAGPPKSPQEKVAEIRAQADIKKIQVDTESEATNEKLRQENSQRDRDHDELMALLAYRTKVLEIAKEQKLSLLDLQKQLSMFVMEKKFEERQSEFDRKLQATQSDANRSHDATKEAMRASKPDDLANA